MPPISAVELKKLAKKGLTKSEAARQLGASAERVSRLGNELGLSFASAWSRPKPPVTKLGAIIQKARLASRFSYAKLAAASGLHEGHARAIEQGMVERPNERTLRALAAGLAGRTSYDELARAAVPESEVRFVGRLRKLAERGLTKSEAARRLATSRDRVSEMAARHGIAFVTYRRPPKAAATEFGRILQAARLAAGHSYSQMAALSGLHRRHVMDIEVGRVRQPTEQTIQALANSLGGKSLYTKMVRSVRGGARRGPQRRR
jgi:transcriptional regulator with XRE-family HTH domain